jgi:hypothetical protein
LPFSGGGLRGSMALMRFNNFSIGSSTVLDRYNSFLDPVATGIAATMGESAIPGERPGYVSLGAAESSVLTVMHERNDVLDQSLTVDALVNGPMVLTNGAVPMADVLAAGTAFSSYLLHFDPVSSSPTLESVLGAINFRGEILAVVWDAASLADTDDELGSIGDYGDQADRGMDFSTAGMVAISADQHTLSFDLDVLGSQMLQFRVLTTTVDGPDFNGDGVVNGLDLAVWQSGFGLNATGDADGDGDTDGRDFLAWQREQVNPLTSFVAVPEPTSLLLASLVAMSFGVRRRLI